MSNETFVLLSVLIFVLGFPLLNLIPRVFDGAYWLISAVLDSMTRVLKALAKPTQAEIEAEAQRITYQRRFCKP